MYDALKTAAKDRVWQLARGAVADLSQDKQGDDGATVLHMAACNGYCDIAEYLLTHNAHVDIKDDDGWTALCAAVHWGHYEMVKLLVSFGASLATITRSGEEIKDLVHENDQDMLALLDRLPALAASMPRHPPACAPTAPAASASAATTNIMPATTVPAKQDTDQLPQTVVMRRHRNVSFVRLRLCVISVVAFSTKVRKRKRGATNIRTETEQEKRA